MPTRYLDVIQPKGKLAVWAWSPVIVLRVALVATYLGYVYSGIIAFMVGVPVFDLTTPPGWTPIWAALLTISALVSAVGSVSDRWQKIERWASLLLAALLLAYVGGLNIVGYIEHDLDRLFVGGVAFVAAILPVTRFIYLAAQSGKRRIRNDRSG
jgi:hypothetical protein